MIFKVNVRSGLIIGVRVRNPYPKPKPNHNPDLVAQLVATFNAIDDNTNGYPNPNQTYGNRF